METKTIEGEIQNIRPKAVAIENNWYGSFKELTGFNKNDIVRIAYTENKKDGKTFLNIKSIEKVQSEKSNNVKIPDTTVNTILMKVFDTYAVLKSNNKPESIESLTNEAIKSYKLISGL